MSNQNVLRVSQPPIPVTKEFSAQDATFSAKDAPHSAKDATTSALDVLNKFAAKLDSMIKNSPVSDIEKNARQHFVSQLAKQGLVTREEYEVQLALLERACAKLKELESKIAHLEQERHKEAERLK